METSTLTPHYEDNDMDYRDFADFARQSLDGAMDANRSIAMRQMEVLNMQADETQALLQSGNLTNEQFDKVMQDLRRFDRQCPTPRRSSIGRILSWLWALVPCCSLAVCFLRFAPLSRHV